MKSTMTLEVIHCFCEEVDERVTVYRNRTGLYRVKLEGCELYAAIGRTESMDGTFKTYCVYAVTMTPNKAIEEGGMRLLSEPAFTDSMKDEYMRYDVARAVAAHNAKRRRGYALR